MQHSNIVDNFEFVFQSEELSCFKTELLDPNFLMKLSGNKDINESFLGVTTTSALAMTTLAFTNVKYELSNLCYN